jgi:hypothetical protein
MLNHQPTQAHWCQHHGLALHGKTPQRGPYKPLGPFGTCSCASKLLQLWQTMRTWCKRTGAWQKTMYSCRSRCVCLCAPMKPHP